MNRYVFDNSPFGNEVHNRIRKELNNGCAFKRALTTLPVDEGEVFSFLPDGFNLTSPHMLDMTFHPDVRAFTGIALDLEALTQANLEFIKNYLAAGDDHVALFDSVEWQKGKPKDTHYQYVLLEEINLREHRGRHAVFYLTHDASIDQVAAEYSAAGHQWPFLIALTSSGSVPSLSTRVLTSVELETLASRTEYLLVGAFHQDTALIWKRDK